MAAIGNLVLGHLLVIALRADHAGEAAFLAEQRAAVEHPLHQPVGHAEHGEGQARGLGILQVAGIDRLVAELRRLRHECFQLVRTDGHDDMVIFF